jgi:two-component system, chemotaxis family, sensor kinase CheA
VNEIDISSLLDEFLEDAGGHVDAVERSLLLMEEAGAGAESADIVTSLLGNLHTLKGNSGMMGFATLQKYLHKLEAVLKMVPEGTVPVTPAFFETFFSAVTALRESLAAIASNPAAPLDFSDETMILEYLASGDLDRAGAVPAAARKRDEFGYITQKSNTLKVNFEKLDELLNLVGELVIHRTTLLSLESTLRERVRDRDILEAFGESSQLIGKTADELREAIMKVRMLPVRVVFQRFVKMVRDLSLLHGKKIRLALEGEDTEIDKTVIDEIGEPLLHLIRNAVDHAIEPPADRIRSGKPAEGTVRLSARHDNNHIVISVHDDGRGISVERVKDSAVSKGLLDSAAASGISDQETLQLVFLPGFSTAREVTETSGRGIGLDVVKKIVGSFNGIIEVESRVGVGTTFTMRLPLTLAIISALMVESSGEIFAVPLSGVLESIRIAASDIHEVAGGEIITLRDRLLPLVRLDSFFSLGRRGDAEAEYIVVIGNGEKRAGIIVDRLIGQQEVVIKALDDYLGEIPGVSGGTVLGDGRISLIMDIASLVTAAGRGGSNG